ncbi:MAG: hypothetical protein JO157_11085 [Acetobacteraceae bacterium]|nr:hypothetical protein [Acetobacteraceae bacterium]
MAAWDSGEPKPLWWVAVGAALLMGAVLTFCVYEIAFGSVPDPGRIGPTHSQPASKSAPRS